MSRNRLPVMNYIPGESETPEPTGRSSVSIRTFESYEDSFQETVRNIRAHVLEALEQLTYIDTSTGYSLNSIDEFVGFD